MPLFLHAEIYRIMSQKVQLDQSEASQNAIGDRKPLDISHPPGEAAKGGKCC